MHGMERDRLVIIRASLHTTDVLTSFIGHVIPYFRFFPRF